MREMRKSEAEVIFTNVRGKFRGVDHRMAPDTVEAALIVDMAIQVVENGLPIIERRSEVVARMNPSPTQSPQRILCLRIELWWTSIVPKNHVSHTDTGG